MVLYINIFQMQGAASQPRDNEEKRQPSPSTRVSTDTEGPRHQAKHSNYFEEAGNCLPL
jgi:hypothetical protein